MRKYFVSNDTLFVIKKKNDTMSTSSKFNKYETCQKKIINSLTNEKYALAVVIFTHVSSLLNFDTNGVVSSIYYLRGFFCLDQLFFFLLQNTSTIKV